MARLAPLPPTLPWQLSFSHFLINPRTSLFLRVTPTHPHFRFAIFHAVRTRDVNFDPWKFDDEDDDDDDDAEFVRRRRTRGRSGRRSRKRRWWSDDDNVDGEREGGILEQLVEGLWIFKVFRSYGLFLPVILISILLATGPKAFLMGSGVPFGLSLLAFAFKKLSEWVDISAIPKPKRRPKRSRFSRKRNVSMEDESSQAQEAQQAKRSNRRSYKTRVNRFGGWDELVTEEETERTERSSSTKDRLEMMTERKVESSMEERELPLLLRLLVGLFPFLGSWTNLL